MNFFVMLPLVWLPQCRSWKQNLDAKPHTRITSNAIKLFFFLHIHSFQQFDSSSHTYSSQLRCNQKSFRWPKNSKLFQSWNIWRARLLSCGGEKSREVLAETLSNGPTHTKWWEKQNRLSEKHSTALSLHLRWCLPNAVEISLRDLYEINSLKCSFRFSKLKVGWQIKI